MSWSGAELKNRKVIISDWSVYPGSTYIGFLLYFCNANEHAWSQVKTHLIQFCSLIQFTMPQPAQNFIRVPGAPSSLRALAGWVYEVETTGVLSRTVAVIRLHAYGLMMTSAFKQNTRKIYSRSLPCLYRPQSQLYMIINSILSTWNDGKMRRVSERPNMPCRHNSAIHKNLIKIFSSSPPDAPDDGKNVLYD